MEHQNQDSLPAMRTFKARHWSGVELFGEKTKVKGQLDHQGSRLGRNRAVRIAQPEVTDLHKAFGQHMLQEAADEVENVQACGAPAVGVFHPIFEVDFSVIDFHDPVVGDSDLKKVLRNICYRTGAVGCWPAIHVEGTIPDRRRDLVK